MTEFAPESGPEESCIKALAEMTMTEEDQFASSPLYKGSTATACSTSTENTDGVSEFPSSSSDEESGANGSDNLDSYLQAHGVSQPLENLVASGAVLEGMPGGPVQGITVGGSKPQICFDFTKGLCTRGDKCKFSHDLATIVHFNSKEKGICFDYLRNQCHRGLLCRFSHDLSNITLQCQSPGQQGAQSVNTGSAAVGGRGRTNAICYDFVKGVCQRGSGCKYSHDLSLIARTGRGGTNAAGPQGELCYDFLRGRCNRGGCCKYSHNASFMGAAQNGNCAQNSNGGGGGPDMGGNRNLMHSQSADLSMLSALMGQGYPNPSMGRSDLSESLSDPSPQWCSNSLPSQGNSLMNSLAQQHRQLAAAAVVAAAAAGANGFGPMQQQAAATAAAVVAAQYGRGMPPTDQQLIHNMAAAVAASGQQQQAVAIARAAALMQQAQAVAVAKATMPIDMPNGGAQHYPPSSAAAAARQHLMMANSAPAGMPFSNGNNAGGVPPEQLQALLSNLGSQNPQLLATALNGLHANQAGFHSAQVQAHAVAMMLQQAQVQAGAVGGNMGPHGTSSQHLMASGSGGPLSSHPPPMSSPSSVPKPIPGRHDSGGGSPHASPLVWGGSAGLSAGGSMPGNLAKDGSASGQAGGGQLWSTASGSGPLSHTAPVESNTLQGNAVSPDMLLMLKEIWNKAS